MLSAQKDGEEKVCDFFNKRVFSREKEWGLCQSKRKTFLTVTIKAVSTLKCKTVEMENNAMSKVVSQFCGTDVTLVDIMKNRITEECLSLFNPNGTMVKTQKSKLLQSLTFVPLDIAVDYTAVVDMGYFLRLCMPSVEDKEKGDETKYSWSDYANKIFTTIMNRHLNAKTVVFVNDPYDISDSIKGEEHSRRDCINGSKNIFIKPNNELPNRTNLSAFLSNKSNKIRLQNFLKIEFQKLSSQYQTKELIYSVQRNCENIKTGLSIPAYECHHYEADTIIFFIIHALRESRDRQVNIENNLATFLIIIKLSECVRIKVLYRFPGEDFFANHRKFINYS